MVDQEPPHKTFVVEIAAELAALLTPENRAFLAAKCDEFWRRVEDIDARWKEAHEKSEWCAQKLGPRWKRKGLVVERQSVLRAPKKWPAVGPEVKVEEFCRRVEKVEARRKDVNDPFNVCRQRLSLRWTWGNYADPTDRLKPKFIRVERQFYLDPPQGDPRHWFPPRAVWWRQPDAKEEIPNEQDALLRDCVLVVLIHDLTFPRHKPVYFRPDRICPGGNWWHESLYKQTVQDMAYIRGSNSPDIEHFKACIRRSLENVAEACGTRGPLASKGPAESGRDRNVDEVGQPDKTPGGSEQNGKTRGAQVNVNIIQNSNVAMGTGNVVGDRSSFAGRTSTGGKNVSSLKKTVAVGVAFLAQLWTCSGWLKPLRAFFHWMGF